jgi:hypothetical protein
MEHALLEHGRHFPQHLSAGLGVNIAFNSEQRHVATSANFA